MSLLANLLHHALTHRIGWIVLHSLWQAALIAVGFALVRMALRRNSAESRYLAGCIALLLLCLAPILTTLRMSAPALKNTHAATDQAARLTSPSSLAEFPAPPEILSGHGWGSSMSRVVGFPGRCAPVLGLAWFAGFLIFSLRLARSWNWTQTVTRRQTSSPDPALLEMLNDLCCRLEISRPVRLLHSTLIEVPTVIGWLRPVILLPVAGLAGLTPEQVQGVLAHELAHIRRLDYLVNAAQCVLETLFFYHPAVWWISRNIREERENCCDDLVIHHCGDRLGYARALATLEERRAALGELAFAANGGSLLARIRRLLGADDSGSSGIGRRGLASLAFLGLGLALIVIGCSLLLGRPTYSSYARIRLADPPPPANARPGTQAAIGAYDPYRVQTEIAVLQSPAILDEVIRKLDLQTQWSNRYGGAMDFGSARALLTARLEIRPVRNSSILDINTSSEVPAEAATLANTIAETYHDWSVAHQRIVVEGTMTSLKQLDEENSAKLREARNEVDRMQRELNLPPAATLESLRAGSVDDARRKYLAVKIATESDLVRQESLLNSLQRLSPPDLLTALPGAVPDTLLTTLLQQELLAEQKLIAARKDYAPGHPDLQAAQEQLADLRKRINERAQGILAGLQVKVSSLKTALMKQEKEIQSAESEARAKADQARPYFEKKRDLEYYERFHDVLAGKIAGGEVDARIPKTSQVEILQNALPAFRPISPNRPLGASVLGLGLLITLMGALMLQWRSA